MDMYYLRNAESLARATELYNLYTRYPQYWLKGIRIVSGASPEAPLPYNLELSRQRAQAVIDYLKAHSAIDASLLQLQPKGEDWASLRYLVMKNADVPYRSEVLQSLERYPDGQEGEWDLKRIAGGEAYRYLYNKVYPQLRQTNMEFEVVREREYQYPRPALAQRNLPVPEKLVAPQPPVAEAAGARAHAADAEGQSVFALKTNLLYDALLSPSIEAEYRFAPRWSAHVDFAIAWWSNKRKHKYYQLVQLSPEARYWFNPNRYWKGHYIGAFVGAGHYDLENGKEGYKGEFMMAGLSYGYLFRIGRRLSLDAGIGVGYLNTEYEEYLPIEGHYVYQQKSRTGYVGPVKARLSLVWQLGRKMSKGGKP